MSYRLYVLKMMNLKSRIGHNQYLAIGDESVKGVALKRVFSVTMIKATLPSHHD